MIINNETRNVVKTEGMETIKYSIDSESFPLLFRMLRDNLYSNKEYSIVREYVSNAIDAHTEAGVDLPVEVEWVDENRLMGVDSQFIVRDFGVGLSPDRIQNIFGKYLASTKRLNNNQIGGLGLGSKSAYSYTDSYFVKTRYDGIEYQYNCYIDEDDLGSITLMHSEPTDKNNGTEIIIPTLQSDKIKFNNAINDQLLFCNIKAINLNFEYARDIIGEIQYEDEDIIITNNDNSLKLLHGPIIYKIDLYHDWNKTNYLTKLNGVYIKCNIGDVKVTLSREDLDYTSKTIELLNKKVDILLSKLTDLYRNSFNNVTNIKELFQFVTKINNYCSWGLLKKEDFQDLVYNGYRPFLLQKHGLFSLRDKVKKKVYANSNKRYGYDTMYFSSSDNGYYNLNFDCDIEPDFYKFVYSKVGNMNLVSFDPALSTEVPSDLVIDVQNYVDDLMKVVESLPKLSDLREEWKEHKKAIKKQTTTQRLKEEVPVSVVSSSYNGLYYTRDSIKLTESDFKGLVVIGNQEDSDKLLDFYGICNSLSFRDKRFDREVSVFKVAKNNNKSFEIRGAIHIKDIMKDYPTISRLATNAIIREFTNTENISRHYKNYSYGYNFLLEYKTPLLHNVLTKLYNYDGSTSGNKELVKEIVDVAIKNNWLDRDVNLIHRYKDFMKGIELLKFVQVDKESLPYIEQYLKEKGKYTQPLPKEQLKLEEAC